MTFFDKLVKAAEGYKGTLAVFLRKQKLERLKTNRRHTKMWGNRYVILKTPGTKILTMPPNDLVPTKEVLIQGESYLIQPRVKIGDDRAVSILSKRNRNWGMTDGGWDNCGWYRGKPVIIDW